MNTNARTPTTKKQRLITTPLIVLSLTSVVTPNLYAQSSELYGLSSMSTTSNGSSSHSSLEETTHTFVTSPGGESPISQEDLDAVRKSNPPNCADESHTVAWYHRFFGEGTGPQCQIDQNNLGPISAIWMAQDSLNQRRNIESDRCRQVNGISTFSTRVASPGVGLCYSSANTPIKYHIEYQTVKCCVPKTEVVKKVMPSATQVTTCEQINDRLQTLPETRFIDLRGRDSSCTMARLQSQIGFAAELAQSQLRCKELGGFDIPLNFYASSRCSRIMPDIYEHKMNVQFLCCRARIKEAIPPGQNLSDNPDFVHSVIEEIIEDNESDVESKI